MLVVLGGMLYALTPLALGALVVTALTPMPPHAPRNRRRLPAPRQAVAAPRNRRRGVAR